MKIAFNTVNLLTALEKVAKVTPTSKTVPILTYVRIDAYDPETIYHVGGRLRLTATDLVSSIVVTVYDVAVKEPGTALLQAAEFIGFLRSLTVPRVALVSADGGLLVKVKTEHGGEHARLEKAPPLDAFPVVADLEDKWTHTLPRADLVRALRLVKPAAASGLSFHPRLEQVGIRHGKVQAADGIRCHEVELPAADLMDIALPLPFLEDALTLLAASSEPTCDIGVPEDGQSLILRHGDVVLMTAVKKDVFPDVNHAFLIPAMTNDQILRLDRAAMLGAVRRVRTMTDKTTKAVKVILSGFSTAEVSAQQSSGAWAKETIPVEWQGGDRTLAFNHEYLAHLLALFEAETLTLKLGTDARHKPSPVLIQDQGRTGVLMQLRLDW